MGRLALALILLASAVPLGAAARPGDDRAPAAVSAHEVSAMPALEAQVLAAINGVRVEKGLRRLRLNRALSLAARGHSASMAEHGFFDHSGYDGSTFWARMKARYRPSPRSYWAVGENLVWASPTLGAQEALDLWLKSPPHRKTLLTPSWREIGLGAVHAAGAPGVYEGLDVTILTADFGVR